MQDVIAEQTRYNERILETMDAIREQVNEQLETMDAIKEQVNEQAEVLTD